MLLCLPSRSVELSNQSKSMLAALTRIIQDRQKDRPISCRISWSLKPRIWDSLRESARRELSLREYPVDQKSTRMTLLENIKTLVRLHKAALNGSRSNDGPTRGPALLCSRRRSHFKSKGKHLKTLQSCPRYRTVVPFMRFLPFFCFCQITKIVANI